MVVVEEEEDRKHLGTRLIQRGRDGILGLLNSNQQKMVVFYSEGDRWVQAECKNVSSCCRWVQAEYKRLGDSDNPDVSELLKTAVRCLKERPVLFKYCAEEVANMRRHALLGGL
ncbi:hypothetical protein C5167_045060 [Papaver somniferum]|uniref:Conserved Oligomeric Golgi complex subunit 6 C-terminal domain-containing protein n=1 Tax=Papaver somniferum TaxID=3469 RepID=A0A4Y7L9R4_PAPSO|nr:hypothetical protein C5167_045060 [Papaver somniferum]